MQDYTRYGVSRASPRTFRRFHLAAHAAAVVFTDAATLLSDAASKSFWLARGQPEHAWPSRSATGRTGAASSDGGGASTDDDVDPLPHGG